jgi:hypothetical protein
MQKIAALAFVFIVALAPLAQAQTRTFTIQKNKSGTVVTGGNLASSSKVIITDDQKLMFEASRQAVARDFRGAEATYSRVIAMNSGNIEAYLQRGVVRRELGDKNGTTSDARTAVALVNAQLQVTPRNPNLYYQRAMGLRLLHQFEQAKQDLRTGMQLGGSSYWETDLKAIDLEQKMAAQ